MQKPRAKHYLNRRRSSSHHQAHAEAELLSLEQLPQHALIPRTEPVWVDSQQKLEELVTQLRAAGSFAYDSEFIGEQSYYPHLCLIQAGTADMLALIDPLADLDLMPFWNLIIDEQVEKIVHAGMQDLEPAYRHTQQAPANIVDTQIAAAFVGLNYPASLATLVEEYTGISLGKGLKFSQWDQRPLSKVQTGYAANDVRFLPAVRAALAQKLEEAGNQSWALEQCASLSEVQLYRFDVDQQMLRVRGAESLRPGPTGRLRSLVAWRDDAARTHNIPPRTLAKDAVLLDLARNPACNARQLENIRGLSRSLVKKYEQQLLEAMGDLSALAEEEDAPRPRRQDRPDDRQQVEAVWQRVEEICNAQQVHPGIVTSKKNITRLWRSHAAGDPPQDETLRSGWRGELLAPLFEQWADLPRPAVK